MTDVFDFRRPIARSEALAWRVRANAMLQTGSVAGAFLFLFALVLGMI